ncbi:hypothetical protein [Candidatus Stoquefichus massiliensis]|uniref:hypothetical protein n=1 Tax=Candidatus Stoquefichus massiliensis TaxID=1470350 RepID=UPI000486E440|nr:hypothetical protein [Candidatus Stoquefichus massiliensis]
MDKKYVKFIIVLVLFLGLLSFSLFLINDNNSKKNVILDLQNKISDLEFDNSMYKQATATDFIDFKKSSGVVDAAFLYQDNEIMSRHGIAIIIDNQFYRIGVDPKNNVSLSTNSKITNIDKNIIEFEYILDNKTTYYQLTINLQENSVNFKLDEVK